MIKPSLGIILLLLCCFSCARKESDCDFSYIQTMTIEIRSSKCTNDGLPFYIFFQFTDFTHFLINDYKTIAHLSTNTTEDTSSSLTLPLIPGKTRKITTNVPLGQSTALYCLFTSCGEEWKHLIPADEGCTYVLVTLGDHEILSVETW